MNRVLNKINTLSSICLLLGASSLIFSSLALADATIVYEQSAGTQKSVNTMQIKAGKIRFTPPDQVDNYSLFNSKTNELTHIDSTKKQYLTMNKEIISAQAQQAKKRMDAMRQEMMKRMEGMTPERKQQVEQMMNNHLSRVEAEKKPPVLEQKKTTRTKTVSGISCSVYESYLKGIKHSELCITSSEKMGLTAEDAKTLISMQDFMKYMQAVAQDMMGTSAPISELKGVPLHTTLFKPDGSVQLETRLSSISTDSINADAISIPADFSVMKMPGTE